MSESVVVSKESRECVSEIDDVIVRTLASLDEPATIATLRKKLPGPYQRDDAELQQAVDSLAQCGRVHRYSPYRVKADRFWDRSPRQYAESLLTTQTVGRFATKNELVTQFKARLKELNAKEIGELVQQLARSGRLHSGRFLGSRSMRYSASPVDAQALLDNAIEQIARRFSTSPTEVRLLVTPAEDSLVRGAENSQEALVTQETLVMEAISELRPGAGGGTIIPIAELRRYLEFKLSGDLFDSALRALEREGRIDFTVHPDRESLGDDGRRERLAGEGGKIYDMLIVRR